MWIFTGETRRYMPGPLMMWNQCKRCYLSVWMLLLQATRVCFNVGCKISGQNVLRKGFYSHSDIHLFQKLLIHSGFMGIKFLSFRNILIIAVREGKRERKYERVLIYLLVDIDVFTCRTFLLWYIYYSSLQFIW